MYLKEISATGFKSFADKLTISLDGKTTCIVGPNGSGKSNIVDAVRWVLGEQSVKSLRGDSNMSDVIFSGSKNRNALNVATVSLTFDNSDNYINIPYNEITVKRRVYRTGENEYFINNEKCRLKDITDLFLDSGIGKSSFNIISQGEVQKIVSESSYDRRVIFESAAEVLKYKKRKEDALKKLDKTHTNLERVNDIIAELEIQVEPLREQSIKAEEYLKIKNELKNIEVALLSSEITTINEEYQLTKEKIEKLNNEIMNLGVQSNKSDTELLDLKNNLSKIELTIKELNNRLLSLTKEEEKINGEKNILKERQKYDASNSKVHENISSLKEEKLKKENIIHLDKIDLDTLQNELESIKSEINNLTLLGNTSKKEYQDSFNEYNEKTKLLADIDHKIGIIEDYINNGGTINNSIKAILNNPRLRGIHQTLGALLEIDEKYLKALDVSLGGSKQFIVVENEDSAKSAINYLKDNKLGRATFFPISVIKPRGVDLDTLNVVRNMQGFISVLMDVVKYDSKYYNVVSNQVGNVLLVDNIDNANKISKVINQRYKIVTLDGDIVHIGGTMTGGSLNTSKSIFEEKHELETLRVKRREIAEVIATLEENIKRSTSKLEDNSEKIRQKEIVLIQTQEKYNTKKSSLDITNEEYNNIINELRSLENLVDSSLSKEEDRIMKLYYETSREKEEVVREIARSTKEKDKISSTIDNIEATNKLNNTSLYTKEKELKTLEINISKMDVLLDNYLRILSEDYEMTYEKAKSNYILEMDTKEARSLVNSYKNRIKQIGMVNVQAIEDYKRVSERYNFLNSQKDDLLNAKDTLLEIINEMDTVMKEEFLTTFNKIDIEFQEVFKQLFKGGSASLKLTNPDDLLETGVDIIASPPGKKLTSINLLSGGEKTLTAICLIFAILNVKPIPFCLFDEVEAALDEANVDNFGKYLNNYKDKTQFLIITHKKRTMEYANTLYGITMQESGVSKLVSVKLDNI
ncbi:chromosome partition protein Smc [Clostridium sp. CAG:710]|nr:chromosome partition protein Smc [Clostridium sp. CAG:710]